MKPFETLPRSVKIKFHLIFSLRLGLGRKGLTCILLKVKILLFVISKITLVPYLVLVIA